MKVLLIHEHGRPHGAGAVTAMYRLHQGLRKAGVDSMIACRRRALDTPDVVELPRADFWEKTLGKVTWRLGINEIHCVSSFRISKFQPFLDADVVNIHGWHTNYFNYLALPRMAKHKPIVGTMHDMWSITGHCSQSYECERWKTGCGKCPHLDVFPRIKRDTTRIEWRLKNWAYQRSDVTFVAPSRWLYDLSHESMIQHHEIVQIPNPVDVDIYRPHDRNDARDQLGLPRDKHIIMFVSVTLQSWGKGGDLLFQALDALPAHLKDNVLLLLLGGGGEEIAKACRLPSQALGFVTDDAQKALIYSAADVLVQPSRAENQSLVILESMSCGTPAVAFDTGGMGEIVDAGPGGLLAPSEDIGAMSAAIARLLTDEEFHRRLGMQGRQSVVEKYSLDMHTQQYIALFERKLAERSGSRETARLA